MAWKKDLSLLLLRLCAGGLMVPHGWGKLNRLMTGLEAGEVKFYNWMGIGTEASLGLAVFGELVAPAFIVLGLFTRWMSTMKQLH